MKPLKRLTVSGLLLVCSVVQPSVKSDEPRRMSLQDIINNVRANERLYENLDVTLTYAYQAPPIAAFRAARANERDNQPNNVGAGAAGPDGAGESTNGKLIATADLTSRIHCVLQGGFFRGEREGKVLPDEGGQYGIERIRAFDGTTTRLFERKNYGNIIHGRSEDELFVRPHMFLLAFMDYFVPLSTYLSGHEAMHAYPGCILSPECTIEVSYQGEAEFKGLKCHRVWITSSAPGFTPHDRWDLWLAEDRNFIPVRNLGYTFRFSKTNPLSEGEVTDWREVEAGIWFPTKMTTKRYNEWKPLAPDVRKLNWSEERIVEMVSLKPSYKPDYFRDVPFPDGIPVYEVENEKIIKSYVEGGPIPKKQSTASRRSLLWINLAAIALVVGLVCLWYRWRLARRVRLAEKSRVDVRPLTNSPDCGSVG